eukprot:CAMPEP_0202821072 /NCGR_PEP_ID=MMETSP1389-20130828/10162_1 /ASSEMBLY_ACC=CAM_ASM_000865 /TAXON_ID=302021 /ORGANISM="Rhodomonas sp., Strain CCMP768" /LENGTH=56 /DNA_ID=CAMNT_0049493809 /DNA_START=596 /DNA_END=762 /DNA_ORIENTATION=+
MALRNLPVACFPPGGISSVTLPFVLVPLSSPVLSALPVAGFFLFSRSKLCAFSMAA